jgi:hypothetical protein
VHDNILPESLASSPGTCQIGCLNKGHHQWRCHHHRTKQIVWRRHHRCHCLHHDSEANQPEDHKYSSLYCGFYS